MNTKNETTQKLESKGPSLHAYSVRDGKGEGQKGYWTKIGSFFEHEDGEGGTLPLDALPLDGRIVLRTPKAES